MSSVAGEWAILFNSKDAKIFTDFWWCFVAPVRPDSRIKRRKE
jgi:hypothetical protein